MIIFYAAFIRTKTNTSKPTVSQQSTSTEPSEGDINGEEKQVMKKTSSVSLYA